ncbi:aldo/keto reductase [Corynebacterium frankenforstense DSM 45800]|uniref:Aldo/keto reductase n=1 Tax=Corynebacterium frankenforstense DSM 45800 TaxID=1437875 RepID=A0A1L7CSR6_9CORY|nr:aldo/keto reductase [Corynebacterium frankenforstense]APT88828.1 aldo/keto reductase [Corynebacterium frankenforstense DSM 45800]
MESRTVGRSGLRVGALGLGTDAWGTATHSDDARAIARAFLDAGGSLVDTSPAYGAGRAEEVLARVLADLPREELVLSSAAGVDPTAPVGRRVDCSRRSLLAQLDRTLTRLGTDHLDLWSVGYFDRQTPMSEVTDTLAAAVASGKVRYAGVRDHTGWQLACTAGTAGAGGIVAAQAEYSLLVRQPEEDLAPAAGYLGVGLLARAPLGHGVLAGVARGELPAEAHPLLGARARTIVDALRTAAAGLGVDPAVAALAWVRDRPGVAAAVTGPADPAQARAAFAADGVRLPAAITRALDDVSA